MATTAQRLSPDSIEFILSGSLTDAEAQRRANLREQYTRGVSKLLDVAHHDGREPIICGAYGEGLIAALAAAEAL